MRCGVLLILMCFFSVFSIYSQNNIAKLTYDSFGSKNFTSWPQYIETVESEIDLNPDNRDLVLDLMKYYYGLIGHFLDVNDKKSAEVWCKKMKKSYDKYGKPYSSQADFIAYSSLITAFEIAISPYKAPLLAASMFLNSKKAITMDPNSVVSNISYANFLYFFPEALGGDRKRALQHYTKVYNYFEKNSDKALDDWRYLYIISTLGVFN